MSQPGAVGGARSGPSVEGAARGHGRSNLVLASLLVTTVSATLAIVDPRLRHWFMLPVTACGALIAVDAVGWLRRQLDIFDPHAILSLLGLHFFYLAPVLHVMLDRWPEGIPAPPEWRQALAVMACVNVAGLTIYRLIVAAAPRSPEAPGQRSSRLVPRSFYEVGLLAVAVSVSAFGLLTARFGGVGGYARTVTGDVHRAELAGWGWLILLAEAFPMIAFVLVVVRWRSTLAGRRSAVLLVLAGLAVVQFLVAGLRGSRSNTLWPVLICLVLVHLLVLRISRKLLLVVAVLVGAYVYVYGLYKSAGLEVLDAARGTGSVAAIESRTGRDVPTLLLGDMARADVQALVLDRQLNGGAKPAYGITYLGDMSFLVPRSLLPERPPDKVAVGTDVTYGPGAHQMGWRSSKIYGLTGEAVMNFGPLGGVASFGVLGVIVRLVRGYYLRALRNEALVPKLVAPLLWPYAFLPNNDLDNVLWFQLKYIAPVALVIWLSVRVGRGWAPHRAGRRNALGPGHGGRAGPPPDGPDDPHPAAPGRAPGTTTAAGRPPVSTHFVRTPPRAAVRRRPG